MEQSDFVHLHVHSSFSLLDGVSQPKKIVKRAAALGQKAVALTDHGSMYGIIDFYKAAEDEGIKPLIGCELYLSRRGHTDKDSALDRQSYHLLLLARNEQGYRNLMHLVTVAHLEGFYYHPRVDHELLHEFGDGLFCLSGCLGGEIPRAIRDSNMARARELVRLYQSHFGEENFFLEVQHHPDLPEQEVVNRGIFELGEEFGIPVVATNDSHYSAPEENMAQDVLICLQTNSTLDDTNRMSMMSGDYSLISTEDMASFFPDHPEVITNTLLVAERCNVKIELGKARLPRFTTPNGEASGDYLRSLCEQGLTQRYPIERREDSTWDLRAGHTEDELPVPLTEITERLDFELGVIDGMGFSDYFLIVWDFVKYAKDRDILVGPGRGSAAGALVTYSLNITDLDPLRYDLLFERFLNPDRISMPDADIDFDPEYRDQVIDYVREKYGRDRVANVITFGTMAAKGAIRDVGRVMGMSFDDTDRLSKTLPNGAGVEIAKSLESEPDFKKAYDENEQNKRVVDLAANLEGVTRHTSVHACAVVISDEPLEKFVPLQHASRDEDLIITQYEAPALEALGLLKMDFLGLRNLSVIRKTVDLVRQRTGEEIDMSSIPLDDAETYKVFAEGETTAVFQFESSGMKRYLRQLKPNRFDDIIAMVALYRPGPMQFIDEYCARKHGQAKVAYDHPLMKEALESTYGITVYQEQVMQMSRDLGGFTRGEADTLRKAMGKKNLDLMAKLKDKFIAGCANNDIAQPLAEKIWKDWEAFASYAFNKSHAACYAYVAYQTAYLKCHYPKEFVAADLTSEMDKPERVLIMIDECRRMGIPVLSPSVNESDKEFSVVDEGIRFGLQAVKNVGTSAIESLLEARRESGPFTSLFDFCSRVDLKLCNKRMIESLIKANGMEDLGERGALLASLEDAVASGTAEQTNRTRGQFSLFGGGGGGEETVEAPMPTLKDAPPLSEKEKLLQERELLGFYVTGHPLKPYQADIDTFCTNTASTLADAAPDAPLRIAGIVSSLRRITTKTQKYMAVVTCEDFTGSFEVVIFPEAYEKCRECIEEDALLLIIGTRNGDEVKVSASQVIPLDDARQRLSQSIAVDVDSKSLTKDGIGELKRIAASNTGVVPMHLRVSTSRHGTLVFSAKGYALNPTDAVMQQLRTHPAVGHVAIEPRPLEKEQNGNGRRKFGNGNGNGWKQ